MREKGNAQLRRNPHKITLIINQLPRKIYTLLTTGVIPWVIAEKLRGSVMPVRIPHRRTTRHSLLRDQQGLTALEFAMIAPVFLLMIMGIIEFSMIMYANTIMESATNSTSRLGKTGYVPTGLTRQQAITNSISTRAAGLLDTSRLTFNTKVYSDFNRIGDPEPCISPVNPPCNGAPGVNYVDVNGNGSWDSDMGAAGLGQAGDVVVYTVSYPWQVMTPIVRTIIGSTLNITVRSVVRNEPFGSALGAR